MAGLAARGALRVTGVGLRAGLACRTGVVGLRFGGTKLALACVGDGAAGRRMAIGDVDFAGGVLIRVGAGFLTTGAACFGCRVGVTDLRFGGTKFAFA